MPLTLVCIKPIYMGHALITIQNNFRIKYKVELLNLKKNKKKTYMLCQIWTFRINVIPEITKRQQITEAKM